MLHLELVMMIKGCCRGTILREMSRRELRSSLKMSRRELLHSLS